METKPFEDSYRRIQPCSAGMCTDKIYGTTNRNVQAFNGFPCTDKASNLIALLPKIQDVSRHPDTVAAVKIYSYVTAFDIFQHRQDIAPEFSRLMLPQDFLSPNRIIAVILLTGQ